MIYRDNDNLLEEVFNLLAKGFKYLYKSGGESGHWNEVRSTALAGMCISLRRQDSTWVKSIKQWLEDNQIKEGTSAGSWSEEIWDTSMAILAMKYFEVSSYDRVIISAIDWILSNYSCNKRNNWHDEPWETSWALLAIINSGLIKQDKIQFDICDPVRWLIHLQDQLDGKVISAHYTAYLLLICEQLPKKVKLEDSFEKEIKRSSERATDYLLNELKKSKPEILWTGESWSNGQILWVLSLTNKLPIKDDELLIKIVNWFKEKQEPYGNWSDIEDTASAILGLYSLLSLLNVSPNPYPYPRNTLAEKLEKISPTPKVYLDRKFIESNEDIGGFSIHISRRKIKIISKTIGIIAALLAFIWTFIEFGEYVFERWFK